MDHSVRKNSLIIPDEILDKIKERYNRITNSIINEYWENLTARGISLFVGSYGRGTAILTSDIDVLIELPRDEYHRFDQYKQNGQSSLLQAVRNAVLQTYPRSNIKADGQIVKIQFTDGIKFEILPAFINYDNGFIYPDSNMGGKWQSTYPQAEQFAMKRKNKTTNGLLFDTCKHIRFLRDTYFSNYHLSGIVIDSFIYNAIGDWHWIIRDDESQSGKGVYENILLDYFNRITSYGSQRLTLSAPGSEQPLPIYDSQNCLHSILKLMAE